ncbi:permease, partial [Pseudomonas aeruginosa]|uniref:permease n=1 Tax=Pseudomonas aeruginosa TaxID=287 RepID=UPI0031B69EC3
MLGASFGAATPFFSCSSIPLFLGFTTARIPIGITMSFLITSPLINEIAVVLLWGLLGWKLEGRTDDGADQGLLALLLLLC